MDVLAVYPFLAGIPTGDLCRLDVEEIWLPDENGIFQMQELERELDAHVMVYKLERPPRETGSVQVCEMIRAAKLGVRERNLLQQFESGLGSGVVVAYARPIVRR